MSMDLTGIRNQNEYYTNHYFSSIFEENASATIKRWRDEASFFEVKTPWSKLLAFATRYFSIRDAASRGRGVSLENGVNRLADELLSALSYPICESSRKAIEVEPGLTVPVALEMTKANGASLMWVLLCRNETEDDDIMEGVHFTDKAEEHTSEPLNNESLLSKVFFSMDEPPRWVMLVSLHQVALIDRNKWNEKRFLVFDLNEIFSRREESTLQAMAVLLHRESICPEEGNSLLDTLDDNSHKHAAGVSKDLKYALRECIEMLGNEVVYDMRERQHVGVFGKDLANDLTLQCLRYMYRILFMLFIEAKPELGYAPMKADAYALGYSFESLREITDRAHADSDMNRDGYYIKDSLDMLFRLVYEGYPQQQKTGFLSDVSVQGTFRMEPLKAHIFDPERTALIEKARLRNEVMLSIIDKMSLTRPQKGKRRGRISYSNLGINQLGSVYEALLSYRGFFAEEDLYEVKRKGDSVDELDVGYFVTERELSQYDEDERVRVDENDPKSDLRVHPKGQFIYRLAGREREKSASYYTPEVLTKCLVKYALKELLQDKTADDILNLTVCEPAMGSAAFLNEAVSQLAEAYLLCKEKEIGKTVPSEDRAQELQKVKMLIADRNVYGIDLNPTAVELAEVSLWLNTIYQGGYVPWFRTQIVNGNSLIGARRQCYALNQTQGRHLWYESAPERIVPIDQDGKPGKRSLRKGHIYHFLLGDPGMCSYTDKVIKSMEPENIALIKAWNKAFTRELTDSEQDDCLRLSGMIDTLWDAHTEMRREIKEKCSDPLSVWGQPEDTAHSPTSIRDKDRMYDELYLTKGGENASPYARLKAVMDYWCALWFWPIDKAEYLPTRQEFLWDINMLLGIDVVDTRDRKGQLSLFDDLELDPYARELADRYGKYGSVNLDKLRTYTEEDIKQKKNTMAIRLSIANNVANQQHFFHWELEFADIFSDHGGFDLFVGNPPWIKTEWNEQSVLGDHDPMLIIKKKSAADITQAERERVFTGFSGSKIAYYNEYESIIGMQSFLNAYQNYPLLKGIQTNLFKCFLPQAWTFSNPNGMSGFLHPEGVYDDPKGGKLRSALYPRLRYHFQFQNELMLFPEVAHRATFSINIYENSNSGSFDNIGNLFTPETIDSCYAGSIYDTLYGFKDDNDNWSIQGHPDRIISIGQRELKLFAKLFDDDNNWKKARLPVLHARQLVDVLQKLSDYHEKIGDYEKQISCNEVWHETNAQKDGTILRNVHFPSNPTDMICSGPHISVANPIFKTSRRICVLKSDYDPVDLTAIDSEYLQRCNYKPACNITEYYKRYPQLSDGSCAAANYRVWWRCMLNQSGERTLLPAIVPPNVGHINLVYEFASTNNIVTIVANSLASVVYDFFVKATGQANGRYNAVAGIEAIEQSSSPQCKVEITKVPVHGKEGYFLQIGASCWEIELQVPFTDERNVPIPSKADFVFWPKTTGNKQRPVVVFTDGFLYHKQIVDADTNKRMAIRTVCGYPVWSLTWKDVQDKLSGKGAKPNDDFLSVISLQVHSRNDSLLLV